MEYTIAEYTESDELVVVARFEADSDDDTTAWAEAEYDQLDWYVLDANGENVNG